MSGRVRGQAGQLRLLMRFVAPYRALALATLAALVLDMGGMLFVPTKVSAMINAAVSAEGAGALAEHAWGMLAAALCGSGGAILAALLASRLAANVGRDIRVAVYEASLAYSGADFERFGTGGMVTRTLSDANVIQQTLLMGILMILPVPVMSVIAVALAFSIDEVMGWVLLGVTLIVLAITVVAVRHAAPIFTRLQGFIDRMNVRLREAIGGVRVIRAFGRERQSKERLEETFDEYAENAIRVNVLFSTADSMTFFLMNGVESLILWMGADRVGAWAMQIGSITALIEYAMLIMFFMMMAQFALLSVPRALACLARAGEVLALEPEIRDAPGARALPAPDGGSAAGGGTTEGGEPVVPEGGGTRGGEPDAPGRGRARNSEVARLAHTSLRFRDADEDTLHDVSFSLRRGEVTAIIGNTGSGKSTIAKMLLRFHDATAGSVTFGGEDVRALAQASLRSRIAYVPQRAWLFSGTIADNLRFGDPDATDRDLWRALDVAQASFVRELSQGLASRVAQGGTNFSGGQRQRLAIARALVRTADLYLFDDSFSALDFKTDAALRHALRPALADAAMLVIAQRVSTIREADQIVVLDDGRVAGIGTHEVLMDACPTYRLIAESQERRGGSHE